MTTRGGFGIALFILGLIIGIVLFGQGTYTQQKVYNTEAYEWVDYKGNTRRIVVTREVHT